MRKLAVLTMLALPATAVAQPGVPAPHYAQPPAPEVVEPKGRLEIGVIAGFPRGTWELLNPDTSPGFHLQLGYEIAQNVGVFGGLRYMRVNYDSATLGADANLSHRDVQLGVRFTTPMGPTAKLFVEGNLQLATLGVRVNGSSASESGFGLGGRAGMLFTVAPKAALGIAVGYSSATITADGDEFDDEWVTADGSFSFFF